MSDSDSTVFHCVNEVCLILYEDLQSVIIRWPKGEYAERVMEGFREKQVIGYRRTGLTSCMLH